MILKPQIWKDIADHFSLTRAIFGVAQCSQDDTRKWNVQFLTPLVPSTKLEMKLIETDISSLKKAKKIAEIEIAKETKEYLKLYFASVPYLTGE